LAFQIKLNGIQIKSPKDFRISHYKLTKAGRVASGKMVMEVIAKKRKFELDYEVLKGKDLRTILDILNTDQSFFELEYIENDEVHTATVYVGEISYRRFRTDSGAWYWKDVAFDLIEQ